MDEAGFTQEGVFNMHNTHVWAKENPHSIREHRFSTTIFFKCLGNY
jgi:hypothetical protein